MRSLTGFAVTVMMLAAFVSCKKNDQVEPEPQPPVELDNAIEYNGTVTELKSRFVDFEAGVMYLVAQEGVTSAEQLASGNMEYVSIIPGEDVDSELQTAEIDLTDLPAGFEMSYHKDGSEIVSISASHPDAVSEGTMTISIKIMDEDTENVSAEVEFSAVLSDGVVFRGNAVVESTVYEENLYPENDMTFVVDGEESAVGTAAVENFEGYVMFTVTPEPDAGLFNDIYDAGFDYIQVLILPQYLNQDLDVMSESVTIYGWRSSDETYLSISPDGGRDLLTSGAVRIDGSETDGEYTLYMRLDFVGGHYVGVHASGIMTGDAPGEGSTISVNGDTKPVRASFYLVEDGLAMLYFTSAEVYYFDEMMDNAASWFSVTVDESVLGAGEIDITSTDAYFMLYYMDNMTGEALYIDPETLQGGSGTINVSRDSSDPEHFTAEVSAAFGNGTEIVVEFDGSCVSVDYVPEKPNELTYMDVTAPIESVLVDKSNGGLWEIWVSWTAGLETVSEFEADEALHITAPEEAFNCGYGVGFSTFKDTMKFEFGSRTWQWQEDGSVLGTLEVYLEGDQMTLDFTTYGDLSGHYAGTAIIVE